MLKELTASTALLDRLERLIHPAWIRRAILTLPFDRLRTGTLTLKIAGESYRFEGETPGFQADLQIERPLRAYWLMKTQGELGFAQAYIEGAIQTSSLHQLMHLAYANSELFDSLLMDKRLNAKYRRLHLRRHNSVDNSRRNIAFHYDLGNDFYGLWLDPSMTYSSALYRDDTETLAQAQANKYERILAQLDLTGGESILEIGCGWGGFMEAALKRGCTIKGLTLSSEQQRYAKQRLADQAAPDRFTVALQDYRDETGRYDQVVSIEMFEAVGKEYWSDYFGTLGRVLKPGGKAVLQVITVAEEQVAAYEADVDFIQTYIFPGGHLPSRQQILATAGTQGLHLSEEIAFGADYAKTCTAWKEAFNHRREALEGLGYDRSFQRLWNFYLDYCIVGFETRHISVRQLTFVHADR
ncbi:methyltransferase, cyclopropane fatty acid synthase [Thioflavicoccus mobilis 8321]|uniref:Methyltransferase, cyclopropane fatty acid synthase n=1 Tax=Thioflavicoccus mobilis 8321 TaxID=765912 RepID=L0GVA9_9GAMM|nr:cyclopropane-fatty-acyl-phospholipid synthase family protein [Thioflavicoccus mobilis]AGA89767.1 methyltransferase, cyclopropane fatty acid synthase [Thioflavicoccus mobilis 8321]